MLFTSFHRLYHADDHDHLQNTVTGKFSGKIVCILQTFMVIIHEKFAVKYLKYLLIMAEGAAKTIHSTTNTNKAPLLFLYVKLEQKMTQ